MSGDGSDLQEAANIELVRRYRAAPMAARHEFQAPYYRTVRRGLQHVAELAGFPESGGFTQASIPDRVDEIQHIVAHGDQVWATWLVKGTHRGPLFGIEGTGRPVEMLEFGMWTVRDGQLAEGWFMADELALLRQLGLRRLPPLG
jgi:predicted ester cyclase